MEEHDARGGGKTEIGGRTKADTDWHAQAERNTDGQTDRRTDRHRQTDRRTDRQTDRQTEIQRDRHRARHRHITNFTQRQSDSET